MSTVFERFKEYTPAPIYYLFWTLVSFFGLCSTLGTILLIYLSITGNL